MPKPWVGLFRAAGIGDSLIASSPLSLLAKDYNIEMLCDGEWAYMWDNNPYITKLTKLPEDCPPRNLPNSVEWEKWWRDRARGFEKFFNLSHSCEYSLAFAPGQVMFDWPASLRRSLSNRNYLEMVHDICEVPHDFTIGPRFYPTDEEREKAIETKSRMGERLLGICLAGSRIDKVWPYLGQLVVKVRRELGLTVVLFGAPAQRDWLLCQKVFEIVEQHLGTKEGVFSAITNDGKLTAADWPVRRTLAQLQTCDAVITPDTGTAWAVAMEPMPKLVLLSHASKFNITEHWRNTISLHADPKRVPCWPCHRLHDTPDTCVKAEKADAAACMADIHDTVVMEHLHRIFAPRVDSAFAMKPVTLNAVPPEGYVGLRRIEAEQAAD